MYLWQWIPLACLAAAFLATLGVLVVWRRRGRSSEARDPLQRDLMGGPGESQRERIAAEVWNAAEYAVLCVFLPPLVFCVYPLMAVYDGDLPEHETLAAFSLAAAALLGWALARLWRVLEQARNLALDSEAEAMVGLELDALCHLGYCVFHDVPAKGLESIIDHVVVGPAGVFAVSTMARMPPRARGKNARGDEPTEVSYDGERLQFPGWEEILPLGEAVAQADWLCGRLANALNEPMATRAILVLPGWSVKRTAISGIPVLAARRVNAYFSRMRPLPEMTDTLVERIVEQLDLLCRTVAVSPPAAPLQELPPQQESPQQEPPPQHQPEERAAAVH